MKVLIPKGARNSGSVYYFDTDTNLFKTLRWTPPEGGDTFISFYANESTLKAVLAGQGPTVYRSLVGELRDDPSPPVVTPLTDTVIANENMAVSPDGRFAVTRNASANRWIIVDFAASPPSITGQNVGSFPANTSIAMMSFEGGDNRLLVIDADSRLMLLSTRIGDGQAIDTALTAPLTAVPAQGGGGFEGFEGFAVNGSVLLGNLAVKAAEAGFGAPTFIDFWLVASDGQGGFASFRTDGLCTAPSSSGTQIMAYLDGVTLKEALINRDFSYSLTYSGPLPDEIESGGSGGIFYILPAPSNPQPVETPPFWSKFVSCFEVI